ncbi:acid protease [Punctularia strigosozonata HHB-11173 SS5]|uniref:acid protease n=1 Tax=Punctularia strigosozonata (strain HHB-11173) TaxID=741275 RepID=UPI0004416630|nr:acid protease [Punctularia strigosozonata HHB-11173 SS5]EIN12681.1 acid protease [Punctularia strigosozonata HHB-11173 SS5]
MSSNWIIACYALLFYAEAVLGSPLMTLPISTRRSIPRDRTAEWAQHQVARVQSKLRAAANNWHAQGDSYLRTRDVHLNAREDTFAFGMQNLVEFWGDFVDTAYYTSVDVGTPPQTFTVVADTGSADFWLGAPGSLGMPVTFDPTSSSTYKNLSTPIHITYGKGQFNGTLGTDTVSVAGLTVKNAVVESGVVDSSAFEFRKMSGIMGFGWQGLSRSKMPTFVEQLMQTSSLQSNVFSFYLGRGVDKLSPGQGRGNGTLNAGTLAIGGTVSSTYTGDIDYFPIVQKAHWVVQADGMSVNSQVVPGTTGVQAMMDTGTSLIVMPNATWQALATAIGAKPGPGNLLVRNCTSLPVVALRIGGKDYSIATEDLVLDAIEINSQQLSDKYGFAQGTTACLLPFVGGQQSTEVNETAPLMIMGDSFLKSWTSVFDVDNARVGLAAASPASSFNSTADVVNFKLKQEGYKNFKSSSGLEGMCRPGQASIVMMTTLTAAFASGIFVF